MFDDVFDKKGHLFHGRNTPKIVSPLNTLEYSRLVPGLCISVKFSKINEIRSTNPSNPIFRRVLCQRFYLYCTVLRSKGNLLIRFQWWGSF